MRGLAKQLARSILGLGLVLPSSKSGGNQMNFRVLLFLLCTTSFLASAQTPEGKTFLRAASDAAFYCELKSSLLGSAVAYGDSKQSQYSDEISSCVKEKGSALTEAMKSLPNNPESKDLRDSAKSVYSGWLAYSSVLLRGTSSNQQKSSPEGVAFRKALSDYKTELVLTSP